MINYFSEKNRVGTVRRIFHKYVKSYREYLKIAEQRSFELAPERKRAWHNLFRLQRLLNERRALRFEYLLQEKPIDWTALRSLSIISERLDRDWKQEEASLLEANSTYKKITSEIADIQSKWNPNAVGNSSRVLDQDRIFCDALQDLSERNKKLEAQLAG